MRLAAIGIVLSALAASTSAQPFEREPIERNLPDQELLDLLETLELTEIRRAYDALREANSPALDPTRLEALRAELAQLRAGFADSSDRLSTARHIAAVQRRIRHACQALLTAPSEPRLRLETLALLAETDLSLLHGPEALLLTLYAGMPSAAQRDEVLVLATEAQLAAEEARPLVDEVLFELDAELVESDDAALRQERRRLSEDWRDRRLPLQEALAASARSVAAGDEGAATEALAAFAAVRGSAPLSISALHAQAMALLGAQRPGQAVQVLAAAPSEGADLDAAAHLATAFLRARAEAAREDYAAAHAALDSLERLPFMADAAAPALWRVLLADARLRVDAAQAASLQGEAARRTLLTSALRHYERLGERAGDLGMTAEHLQDLLLVKLAACEPLRAFDVRVLPSLALLAQAQVSLARDATRGAGLSLLEQALARDDADANLAGRVLQRGLSAWGEPGSAALIEQAAAAALALAPRLGDTGQAMRLLALVDARIAQARRSGGFIAPGVREKLYHALIAVSPQPDAARWRLALAQFYREERRLDDAVALLLEADTRGYESALSAILLAHVRADQLQLARSTPAERTAALALLEAVRSAQQAFAAYAAPPQRQEERSLGDELAADVKLLEVDALMTLGELEAALTAVDSIEEMDLSPGHERLRRLQLRARILSRLGRTAEAAATLRGLFESQQDYDGPGFNAGGLLALLLREFETFETPGTSEAQQQRAREELLPVARQVVQWAQEKEPERIAAHELRLARALVLAGEADEALEVLERARGRDQGLAHQARHLLARADANYLLKNDEEAFADYSTLVNGLTAQGERDEIFWAATLRRLLILERQGRTEQLQPRIQRLRQVDENLGGEPFYSEFMSLQQRLVRGGG